MLNELFINELINNPELYAEGISVLRADVAIHLIPFAITLIIACDRIGLVDKLYKKIISIIVMIVLGSAVSVGAYVLSHFLILGNTDIDHTVEMIARVWFSYQDYEYVGASLFICSAIAIAGGYLIRPLMRLFIPKQDRCGIDRRAITRPVKIVVFPLLCVSLIATITLMYKGFSGVNHLMINEVCGNDFSIAIDEEYDVCDYVEIYNCGEHACVTDELYLSDDADDLKKLAIGTFTMPSLGRAVISLKDATFGISKDGGEVIYLSDAVGNIIDSVIMVPTESNQSYCRVVDGADKWHVTGCTPGNRNGESVDRISPPVFSAESGFYDGEFDLTLSTDGAVSIYYTVDGSEPTMESYLYDGSIHVYDRSAEENSYRSLVNVVEDWQDGHYVPDTTPVDKAFVVRAIAISDDRHYSDIVTKTYFVNLDKYKDYPVVSLVGDPSSLFGDNGIYVTGTEYDEWVNAGKPGDFVYPNFARRDRYNEARISFEYIDGANDFTQCSGLRIRGNSTYGHYLKPFTVIARKDYSGSRYFPDTLFGTDYTHSFAIRGGYANSVYPYMVKDRDVATLKSFIGTVFINGEFWYSGSFSEVFNKDYFKEYYGVDPDNIIIVKDCVLQEGNEEETYISDEMMEYIESLDLSTDEGYEQFCEHFDVQSYIDLMCIDLYLANTDYIDYYQNSIMWRSREKSDDKYNDGRWRWCLYDVDWCDLRPEGDRASVDYAEWMTRQHLFMKLIENEKFKKQFQKSFVEIADTCFSTENVEKVMNSFDFENVIGYKKLNFEQELPLRTIEEHEEFFKTRREYIFSVIEKMLEVNLE